MMNLISENEKSYTLTTANSTIYDELVEKKEIFDSKYHLFALGLVYGILNDKKSSKSKKHDLIKIRVITDTKIRECIDFCYMILKDEREDREVFNEMLEYADGGVEEIYQNFEQNGSLMLTSMIQDSKKRWSKVIPKLKNINLEELD